MSRLNVEIKARCTNHDRVREILKTRDADFKGTDHQIDTYFKINFGRLKLREGNIENFLVYYDREEKDGPKESRVILYKNTPGSTLKEILVASNGVLVVVDKMREIYFINNVKFHIDTVENLGTFIEIEAIDKDELIGKEKLYLQCEEYIRILGISETDFISCSYSDLVLGSR